ncbi:MAG: chorismate mutase [Vibrionaceae bacterium]
MSLTQLRMQIDELDQQLITLLAQRAQKVCEIGHIKKRLGLPIYAAQRERDILDKRRLQAAQCGISPDLIEDLLRRIIEESYLNETDAGFACLAPAPVDVVLLGEPCSMTALFSKLFANSGYPTSTFSMAQLESAPAQQRLAQAKIVLLTHMPNDTAALGAQLAPLPADCVLILLSPTQAAMNKMSQTHLGPLLALLPLFTQPAKHLVKQRIAMCASGFPQQEHWIFEQLSLWGAELLPITMAQLDTLAQQ